MAEYEGNSHRQREAERQANEKRAEKVIEGGAATRKRTRWEKLAGNEAVSSAGEKLEKYATQKVSDMICMFVSTVCDMVCNVVNIRITGEPMSRKSSVPGGRVSYRKYYNDDEDDDDRGSRKPRVGKAEGNYDDIVFESRGDAEVVLDQMEDLLDHFKVVRVADLYDLAGLSCGYTENKYGWSDLRDAYVDRTRGGYVIRLPRADAL